MDWRRMMEVSVFGAGWSFSPANVMDPPQWSSGTIDAVDDLYSPGICGLRRGFKCQCGNYSGDAAVGVFCPDCRTWVTDDPEGDRSSRMGKVHLACTCDHPLGATVHHSRFDLDAMFLETFPVCPIAYRTESDGTPNGLGRKDERLVEINSAMKSLLPRKVARATTGPPTSSTTPNLFRR